MKTDRVKHVISIALMTAVASLGAEAEDTTPPVIQLHGDRIMKIVVGSSFVDPGAEAQDDVDGNLSSQIRIRGTVDSDKVGRYRLIYKVRDRAGNRARAKRIVKVLPPPDTTAPVIQLIGEEKMTLYVGDPFVDPGAEAYDDRDGNLTSRIHRFGKVDTQKPGHYRVTYAVRDRAKNRSTIRRYVEVIVRPDTTPPQLTLLGDAEMKIEAGESFVDPGATAVDDVDGNLTGEIRVEGSVDTATPGSYLLTYRVEDRAGNSASLTREVNVVEPEKSAYETVYTRVNDALYLNESGDVAIYITPDLNKSEKLIYNTEMLQKITQDLYSAFADQFDFIMLVTNNKERPRSVTYSGVFRKIKNDVEGIGAPLYDNSGNYGSGGRLKGIMHFAYRSAVLRGPTLHEIAHYWANKFRDQIAPVYDSEHRSYEGYYLGSGSHWGYTGFFGGKGQLGGYDAAVESLRDENLTYEGRRITWKIFSATPRFGWNSNGGNSLGYNDVELYLMGMIPKEEVADLMVPLPWGSALAPETKEYLADNGRWESDRVYFMAKEIVRKSWDEILGENNISERIPSVEESQKNFRILTVLLDTQMPQTYEVEVVSRQIRSLTYVGDDGDPNNYNFWEATRGLGTLRADGLRDELTVPAESYGIGEPFISEEILYRGRIYRTVRSPYTGRIWLDRNLGADEVCDSFDDTACYGFLFQFGRGFDGHQERNSSLTTRRKDSLEESDGSFVVIGNTLPYDWVVDGVDDDVALRLGFMSDSFGGGVCPEGYRTPTKEELEAETRSNEFGDPFPGTDISDNFLKLPLTGYRNSQSTRGTIYDVGRLGAYWSIGSYTDSTGEVLIRRLFFTREDSIFYGTRYLSNGNAVRCIKEQE